MGVAIKRRHSYVICKKPMRHHRETDLLPLIILLMSQRNSYDTPVPRGPTNATSSQSLGTKNRSVKYLNKL